RDWRQRSRPSRPGYVGTWEFVLCRSTPTPSRRVETHNRVRGARSVRGRQGAEGHARLVNQWSAGAADSSGAPCATPGERGPHTNMSDKRSEEHTSELQSRFELLCR